MNAIIYKTFFWGGGLIHKLLHSRYCGPLNNNIKVVFFFLDKVVVIAVFLCVITVITVTFTLSLLFTLRPHLVWLAAILPSFPIHVHIWPGLVCVCFQ